MIFTSCTIIINTDRILGSLGYTYTDDTMHTWTEEQQHHLSTPLCAQSASYFCIPTPSNPQDIWTRYTHPLPMMDTYSFERRISPEMHSSGFASSHDSPYNTTTPPPISPAYTYSVNHPVLSYGIPDTSHYHEEPESVSDIRKKEGQSDDSFLSHTSYSKRHSRSKEKKRCSNCYATKSPSWRRSTNSLTKGELLCNACGL